MPTYYKDALPDEETQRMIRERGLEYNVTDRPPAPAPQESEDDTIHRTPGQGPTGYPGAGNYPAVAFNPGHVGNLVDASTDYYEQARLGNAQAANRALDTWNMARRKSGMPDYIPQRTNAQITANAPRPHAPAAAPPAAAPPPAARPPAAAPPPTSGPPTPAPASAPVPRGTGAGPAGAPSPVTRRASATVNPALMEQRRRQMWPVRSTPAMQRSPVWPPTGQPGRLQRVA